jgi:hypothetical protein
MPRVVGVNDSRGTAARLAGVVLAADPVSGVGVAVVWPVIVAAGLVSELPYWSWPP